MLHYGLEWHSLDSYFQFKEISAPGTPESNEIRLYAKDSSGTSTLCYKNDAGTEICLPTSGSFVTGTGVANRVAIWTGTSTIGSDADLTFVTDTLTATKIIAPTSVTISTLTAGSVIFAGTAGLLSQDNANLFWDSTAKTLGIGNTTPGFAIEVRGGTNALANIAIKEASADTTSPGLALLKARGTLGSEAATQSGDGIGNVSFGGWTNAYKFNAARIESFAGSLWSATNSESYIIFATTPNASVTRAERFRIGSAGQWGIGGATYGSSGDIFSSGGASVAPTWVTRATLNAALDHGTLAGLGDDDHTQYALLAGRSGGQTLTGGTASGNNLEFKSTSHSTKGNINLLEAYEVLWGSATNPISAISQRGLTLIQTRDPGGTGTAHAVEGQFYGYSNSQTALVTGFRFCVSDGTNASPGATLLNTGAFLGLIGHDGSAYVAGSKALITMKAAATWTSTSNGTYITFETTPIGSTSRTEQWRIDSTGDLVAKLATQKIDLTTISAGNPNFKITATSDTPTVTWTALGTLPPSTAPAGYIEILVSSDTRYIPFWA